MERGEGEEGKERGGGGVEGKGGRSKKRREKNGGVEIEERSHGYCGLLGDAPVHHLRGLRHPK